ncbi:RecB family exonuclease [Flavobacterium sp. 28A]|uniref:PD-(D/E)XK nuclease family protein n=1 Tax=Flavobacterium sp. 28A TaxID=2735895 RepID=UPI00156E2153|nr:PD-(D/E)XK nuclease family protein [Flavobacterium sp. 28A]NRT16974.1 RecB family exonuclease [Flavobacterium sp. 28A]
MKHLFSTSFDAPVFTENDLPTIGSLGLLLFLERELGLYQKFPSQQTRLKSYLEALTEHEEGSFYSESLRTNKYKVAEKLLSYRDILLSFGWNYEAVNQPQRLNSLAKVEKSFRLFENNFIGTIDRWDLVIEQLKPVNVAQLYLEELIVVDTISLLPLYLQRVFSLLESIVIQNNKVIIPVEKRTNLSLFQDCLAKSFAGVSIENRSNLTTFQEDKSLILLEFTTQQELNDAMAYWADSDQHLFLSHDNVNFDYSLLSFDKPASGSLQNNAQPQIIQLFKLIIPAFTGDFNVHTFLSFLQAKYSPLPYELKKQLLRCFSEKPGIGNDHWNTIIADFIADSDKKSTKEKTKIVELFLNFEKMDNSKAIQKAISILQYLQKWSLKLVHSITDQDLAEQFLYIHQMCTDTLDLIKEEQLLANVVKAFQQIYKPKTFLNYHRQEGSVTCVNDYSQIVSPCKKTVIHLDFYDNPIPKNEAQFLLSEEVSFLKEHSTYYNSAKELYFEQQIRGFQSIDNQLILCYVGSSAIEKHPFHIRLETFFKDFHNSIVLKINTITDLKKIDSSFLDAGSLVKNKLLKLPQATTYVKIDCAKNFAKRSIESASSIESLIQYPFDWVINYVLKLRPTAIASIPEDNQLKGNIAHRVVEQLLLSAKEKNIYPIQFSEEEVTSNFQKIIQEEGMFFMQDESRFELSLFKKQFIESFQSLVQLINENNFKIISCEQPLAKEGDCFIAELNMHIIGFIDLVLEDENGKPFIVDMKWTLSDKKYKEKIETEEAIQLSLYAAAMQSVDANSCGYFLFNQNKFLSTKQLSGQNVLVVNCDFSNAIVLEKINTSLAVRWKEFSEGLIETGEGFPLDELHYHAASGKIELLEDRKMKKVQPYSDLKLFKGQLN